MQFNPLGSLLKTYKKGALNGCFFWEMQLSFLFFYLCFSLIACIELFPIFCVCSDWKEKVSNWWLVIHITYYWIWLLYCGNILLITHTHRKYQGLRTPNEAFFHRNPKGLVLGQTICSDRFWSIWGIFGEFFSTHVCTVSPLSMFFH